MLTAQATLPMAPLPAHAYCQSDSLLQLDAPDLHLRVDGRWDVVDGELLGRRAPDGVAIGQRPTARDDVREQIVEHREGLVCLPARGNQEQVRELKLLHAEAQQAEPPVCLARGADAAPERQARPGVGLAREFAEELRIMARASASAVDADG